MTTSSFVASLNDARRRSGVHVEFIRYFAASALAFGVDIGLYRLGLGVGLHYAVAATAGFVAGAVAAYLASVYWVFDVRAVRSTALEFAMFVAVGLGGLLLTQVLLWIGIERLSLGPMVAKLGAAGFVFLFNFGVRKVLLFSVRPA